MVPTQAATQPKPSTLDQIIGYGAQILGIAEQSAIINPNVRDAQAEAARIELENRRRLNIMLAVSAGLLIVLIAYYLIIKRK
jgi:hypothetical protein